MIWSDSTGSVRRDLERAATHVILGVVPVVITAYVVVGGFAHGAAYDLNWSYYPAARRLLEGTSPYAVSHKELKEGIAFVYPALAVLLFAPLALVGRVLSDHLYMLFCLLLVPATLRVAGVRDWRTYGLPLMCLPVIVGWQGGNVTLPLMFLVAMSWRYRTKPLIAGLIVAAAISVKPFMWPLGLWLLVTRRWRASLWALASGALLNLLAWAAVGFNGIGAYLRVSGQVTKMEWRNGYGMLAVAHHLGLGRGAGDVLLVAGSAAIAAALVYQGFVRHREREAMVVTVALMLVASPLVWSHYFALLVVPIALTRNHLSAIWFVPLAMVVCPTTNPSAAELVLAWAVGAICFAAALGWRPIRWRSAHQDPDAKPPATLALTG